MKALVTGGTRYVGRAVVQRLLNNGWDITVLSRGNEIPSWLNRVTHIRADRHDLEVFSSISDTFDVVLDFVAFQLDDVLSVASGLSGIGQYLFVSSTSAYNGLDLRKSIPATESDVDLEAIYTLSY